MTKAEARKYIGQAAIVYWRDPQGFCEGTSSPLSKESGTADTLARVIGLNARGELVIASTRGGDGDVSDLNAIPLACVEKIVKIRA